MARSGAQARKILNQPAFDRFNGGEISPGPSVETDQEIMDWVARGAETALHPSCTCKMGLEADPMAVVDPFTMKVHGTEGLRVVDASVMPIVSNGNIYAPTMMIAEKAADIILGTNRSPLTTPRSSARHRTGLAGTLSRSRNRHRRRSRRWASTVKPVAAAILCSALSSRPLPGRRVRSRRHHRTMSRSGDGGDG